jgi:hypothetical protein
LLWKVNLPQTKFETGFPCIMNFWVATATKGALKPLVELLLKGLDIFGRWHRQDSALGMEATGTYS